MIPLNCRAAEKMVNTALGVVVEPAAVMNVSPVGFAANSTAAANNVQIDLTIRLNPGTTASLVLYPANEPSGTLPEDAGAAQDSGSKTILTVSRSGRYSVVVPVGSLADFGHGTDRLELRSSDQALGISETF